ncbi:lipocalin family protein [Spirosoma panaciterrae]|uniref:lipocalin family protein n=1 Tax=Spirosoma panaciterrae TaxID=496058 RepID=UPI00037C74C1|nr:lipocalin family protein [Spirosoma panaciterrae]
MNRLTIFLLLFLLTHCRLSEELIPDNPITPVSGQGLPGTWQWFERGYSQGTGYYIDEVSSNPQQTIRFSADGHVQTSGSGLINYQSFSQFRLDTTSNGVYIYFLPSTANYSERITLNGDTLRLYPSCYEGCHLGFLRIR